MVDYNSPKVTLDEIVFEGRNKEYGGYFLRKVYDDHIIRAMVIAGLGFTLAVAGPLLWDQFGFKPDVEEIKEVVIDMAKLPPPPRANPNIPPPPPLPQAPPPPQVKTIKFTPPEVAPDDEVIEPPPKVEEIKQAAISNVTAEGAPDAPTIDNIDVVGAGDGDGLVAPAAEEIFTVVEQMPEPPYNIQKYLADNIRYPANATRNEIQGIVYVNFVVGPDGSISSPAVVKGIGYGCDEEALRVVSKLPSWTPGKQGGRAVQVRISLPIRFKLN